MYEKILSRIRYICWIDSLYGFTHIASVTSATTHTKNVEVDMNFCKVLCEYICDERV